MKKIILSAALVLVASVSTVFASTDKEKEKKGSANSRIEVVASQKEAVYSLIYATDAKGLVRVNIYDAQGTKVYSDYVGAIKSFRKSYDFSELPAGEYQIEVVSGGEKTRKSITIADKTASASAMNVSLSTVDANGKYKIKVLQASASTVMVYLLDADKNVIYADEIEVEGSFERVYDLTKSFTKATSVEVYSQGQTISQDVK